MPEHYTKEALGRTKTLYEAIRTWASARSDVSLIGGWVTDVRFVAALDVAVPLTTDTVPMPFRPVAAA